MSKLCFIFLCWFEALKVPKEHQAKCLEVYKTAPLRDWIFGYEGIFGYRCFREGVLPVNCLSEGVILALPVGRRIKVLTQLYREGFKRKLTNVLGHCTIEEKMSLLYDFNDLYTSLPLLNEPISVWKSYYSAHGDKISREQAMASTLCLSVNDIGAAIGMIENSVCYRYAIFYNK